MSAGWVGLLIGCMVALALLFAVAMGCAAKRGDRQNRRAAERERERERDAANVTRLNEWIDSTTPGPRYGKMPPFDQESA